jgi:hypothetical protein
MAETVKKSRIVSDTDDNLEEALMEEFNLRLKKCMSQDDLQQNTETTIIDNEELSKTASRDLIKAEQENYYEEPIETNGKQNGYHQEENIYENVGHQSNKTDPVATEQNVDNATRIDQDDETSAVYEDIDDDPTTNSRPDLTLTDLCEAKEVEQEVKSAKDRMLLSTDVAPCLLFTQTVTSPMLTPSEENIDFLKGFRRESTSNGDNDAVVTDIDELKTKASGDWVVVDKEENVYENSEFLKRNKDAAIYENLKLVQENIYENLKDLEAKVDKENQEVIYQNVGELRETQEEETKEEEKMAVATEEKGESDEDRPETEVVDVGKQIDKFESEESTQVTESYVETTTVESHSSADKGLKKKKSKKSRKEEKENISVNGTNNDCEDSFYNVNVKNLKSSFSKFDALQKKNVLHVRSSDSSKAQEKFNGAQIDTSNCRACEKPVFQMEQIKAEKGVWHKNCFRCTECNKQLNVDTYQSNEGSLYCKPHFKALFTPKAVEDDAPHKPRKPELIIRESQPVELPPDVVRASDKPDLGLEELQSLNVKERFQVFEHHQQTESNEDRTLSTVNVKRSPSILSKLAKFQAKGMDIGVADDSLNGIPIEESSSEEEEEDDGIEGEDADLIRAKKVQKEKPFHFTGMSDVKSRWEQGEQHSSRDERREERKQEIQSIRNRLFMGKQGKMKEAYQQAVMESESCVNLRKEPIEICDTKSLKERFEKGELVNEHEAKEKDAEDTEVFESEISKKSRSLFLELDANASKAPQLTPISTPKIDVKKVREAPTPDRDVYRDPEIVRSEELVEDSVIAKETHTATKMLNKFRQMEENLTKEPQPSGPKPLKRFTPPPEPARPESSSEAESGSEEESEEEDEPDNVKVADDDLIEAQKAARAKQLRAKFERWEANEIKKEQNSGTVNIIEELGEEQSQIESTKSLRARFESMREGSTETNRTPRVKVNRFV